MNKTMRLTWLLLFVAGSALASSTPQQVVLAFFGPAGIPDKDAAYTGEMLRFKSQPTLGQQLPSGVKVGARQLVATPSRIVYDVSLVKGTQTDNWYAYVLLTDGKWKLEAVRTLALTGIPAILRERLASNPHRTQEEEWTLRNLNLLFRSDRELQRYVQSNLKALSQVVTLANSGDDKAADAAAKKLYLDTAVRKDNGIVELVIGGVIDNSVGIMYVPTGASPPPMTPADYIYIEKVAEHWYLYKTT